MKAYNNCERRKYLCCSSFNVLLFHIQEREKLLIVFGLVIQIKKNIYSFSSWHENIFCGLESLFLTYFFFSSLYWIFIALLLSFFCHFAIAQIYALTTCLIPRLLEWRKQMSCSWLAPIHALRHHFLTLEFERGMYPLVVNEHADASGFGTMLGWSRRQ